MKRCALAFPFLVFSMLFLNLKCKDDIVPPPPNNGPDTTSHNFIWKTDTIGEVQTWVNGVWGTSTTDFYIAGYFTEGSKSYPIAHVVSNKPNFLFPEVLVGRFGIEAGDMVTVFGLHQDAIWIAGYGRTSVGYPSRDTIYGVAIMYDGSKWKNLNIQAPNERIVRIWGSSENNVWMAGSLGSIFRFDGANWTRIGFGTHYNITDIWGIATSEVYVTASSTTGKGFLKMYDDNGWSDIDISPYLMDADFYSVWGNPKALLISSSSGCYRKDSRVWSKISVQQNYFPIKVRGLSEKDLWICFYEGTIMHYNGSSWKSIEFPFKIGSTTFNEVCLCNDGVLIVGSAWNGISSKGLVMHGERL